jgi:hypothetical protein
MREKDLGQAPHTMPGNSPPSATPSMARTATKPAKLRTKPRHMVIIPQTIVRVGNQIFGDAFLIIRLLGSSLPTDAKQHDQKSSVIDAHLQIYVR